MDYMSQTVSLKSLSTGLVGTYPAAHLGMDPDLVLADSEADCGCWGDEDEVDRDQENDKEVNNGE